MQIGIDIQDLAEFKESINRTPQLLQKIFHEEEIKDLNEISIAGKFCAKEAAIKSNLIPVGEWLKIKILNKDSGKPIIVNAETNAVLNCTLSISHTKSIIVAVAVKI